MKIKIFIISYFILNSFLLVQADTLTDKIANLTTKVNELASTTSPSVNEMYPVGSIYISYNSTNPTNIFGGTWEAYASGKKIVGNGNNGTTTYTAGNTGGNSSVTLAVTNVTSHTHTLTPAGTVSSTFTGRNVNTSSAGAHTHFLSWASVAHTGEGSGYGLGYGYSYLKNRPLVTGGTITLSTSNFSTSTHSVTPAGTVSSSFSGTGVTSSSSGSTGVLSIQNPYVTVYMWKRTA